MKKPWPLKKSLLIGVTIGLFNTLYRIWAFGESRDVAEVVINSGAVGLVFLVVAAARNRLISRA